MKKDFFVFAGLIKPRAQVVDDGYHNSGNQLSLLSRVFCFKLRVCPYENMHFTGFTLVLHKYPHECHLHE